jgi:hypothetical protein
MGAEALHLVGTRGDDAQWVTAILEALPDL